ASCGPGCWPPRRRRRTGRRPTPGAARSAPWTAASGCAPTTSRRTGSPTTGSATPRTTWTTCWTATWTACSTRWPEPTPRRCSPAVDRHASHASRARRWVGWRNAGAAGRGWVMSQEVRALLTEAERRLAGAGVASSRYDAEALLDHLLGAPNARYLTRSVA